MSDILFICEIVYVPLFLYAILHIFLWDCVFHNYYYIEECEIFHVRTCVRVLDFKIGTPWKLVLLVFPWESHAIFCSDMVLAHWMQLLIFQLWFYSETYSCTLGSGSFGFSCIDSFFNIFQSSFRFFFLNWYLGINHY